MGHTPGELLDRRYELRRTICEGTSSELYEAKHLVTDRTVAVQVLTDEGRREPEQVELLLEEAALRTKARHRFVVAVLDAGRTAPDDPYLVTEMDEGRTLDGLLASRGSLPVLDVLPIALAITEALACAHARGVVHGRLSAASILLVAPTMDPWTIEGGQSAPAAKLLDVGRALRPTYSALGGPLSGFGYVSQEQLMGTTPDALGDVYALGAIVFESLTGQLPTSASAPAALAGILDRAAVPTELAELLLSTLGSRPERPASMMALLRALDAIGNALQAPQTAPPPRRRRTPRASYVTPVQLAQRGRERVSWQCQDISEGGMLIVGPRGVSTGEKVHVRFALPRSGTEATITAMVRWVRPAKEDQAAAGIEFIGPPTAIVTDIREYVAFFTRDETGP